MDCLHKRYQTYTIEYKKVKTKRHGVQDIPTSICFMSEYDYLKFINKEKEVDKFRADLFNILSAFPELHEWTLRYPNKVLENDWNSLLKVCEYFKNTPKPHLYIRELPIQVHTKFIESNKGIIKELLDIIIASHANLDEKHFETRFNLKYDEPLVRFRVLDNNISKQYMLGFDDVSIPISEFKQLSLPIQTVYVVENKINMLTFPSQKDSIVIWGHI